MQSQVSKEWNDYIPRVGMTLRVTKPKTHKPDSKGNFNTDDQYFEVGDIVVVASVKSWGKSSYILTTNKTGHFTYDYKSFQPLDPIDVLLEEIT